MVMQYYTFHVATRTYHEYRMRAISINQLEFLYYLVLKLFYKIKLPLTSNIASIRHVFCLC